MKPDASAGPTDDGRTGRPIAIFDSGIGGLPYLEPARASMPAESFVYVADRADFPYGTKTREEVRRVVLRLVSKLVDEYDPKAIVIACNTASQAALDAVRRAQPGLPIIGTVPAVKPAAERTRSGTIGIMATEGASRDPYLDSLVERYAKGVNVIRESAQPLVSFVERRAAVAGAEERREAVRPYVRALVDRGADEIVLACTHFLHLREDIAEVAGKGVEVVDSRAGVTRRLRQVLGERNLLRSPAEQNPQRSADQGNLLRSPAELNPQRSANQRSLVRSPAERNPRRSADQGNILRSPDESDPPRSAESADSSRMPSGRLPSGAAFRTDRGGGGIFLLSGTAPIEAEYRLLAEAFELEGPLVIR